MKTCPKCKMSGIPEDAKFCPQCGNKLSTYPLVMPSEVDYSDEFLGMSDWRYTFHYMINGQYRRFYGKITDGKSSPRKTFVINCKENGYIRDITLFHYNGNVAMYMRSGIYLQDFYDNVEQEEFYSESGQPISQANFVALYEILYDNFEAKMSQIKTADSGYNN